MFLEFAPAYFEYMAKAFYNNIPTVLCKILGVYTLGFHNKETGKKVQLNLFFFFLFEYLSIFYLFFSSVIYYSFLGLVSCSYPNPYPYPYPYFYYLLPYFVSHIFISSSHLFLIYSVTVFISFSILFSNFILTAICKTI